MLSGVFMKKDPEHSNTFHGTEPLTPFGFFLPPQFMQSEQTWRCLPHDSNFEILTFSLLFVLYLVVILKNLRDVFQNEEDSVSIVNVFCFVFFNIYLFRWCKVSPIYFSGYAGYMWKMCLVKRNFLNDKASYFRNLYTLLHLKI